MGIANLIGGFCVFGLGSLVTYYSSQMAYEAEYGPGPGFLPLWIGIALLFSGGVTIARAIYAYRRSENKFFQTNTRKVVFLFFFLLLIISLTPILGLSPTMALFTGCAMRTLGHHKWATCLLVASATAIGIYAIFGYALAIPLPYGIFGF